jgi:hypothetical protein
LENYDAIGKYRDKQKLLFYPEYHGAEPNRPKPTEVDLALDISGWLAGLPQPEFSNPRQLGMLLANSPQCEECIVKKVFRYMTGRQDTRADMPAIQQALDDFRNSGFHFKAMVVSLVKSWDFPPTERTPVNVASNKKGR